MHPLAAPSAAARQAPAGD